MPVPFGIDAFNAAGEDLDPMLGSGLTKDAAGTTQPEGEPEKPTLWQRFNINRREAFSQGTLLGAGENARMADIAGWTAPEGRELDPETQAIIADARSAHNREIARRLEYEFSPSFTEAETPAEQTIQAIVAGAGQVAGSILTPESLIGLPVRTALWLGRGLAKVAPRLGATGQRLAVAGIEGAAVNVATDPLVQAFNVAAELQKEYDLTQTALAAPTGFVMGASIRGAFDQAGRVFHSVRQRMAQTTLDQMEAVRTGAPEAAPTTPESAGPAAEPVKPAAEPTALSTGATPEPLTPTKTADVVPEPLVPKPATTVEPIPEAASAPELASGKVFTFPVADLKVAPEVFQYKSGGDAEGVTQALKGITQWDEAKAGRIIVWQALDGETYVADGHQRTGLARRLMAAGQAGDLKIAGLVYREADGFSSADVMAVAAAANLASGTGSAVDAAKILRVRPDLLDGSLSPNSTLIRDARGLTTLSDDAFKMVVNEVVPENYAAIVGRMFPDSPDMQIAAMDALVRAEPANATEATILVERVKSAGLARAAAGNQGSLFGELFDSPTSTVIEEMRIVAKALKLLKSDARLLSGAANQAERLEVAGSKIAVDQSKAMAQENAAAAEVASKLYDTAGPVRDALKAVALEVKDGETSVADAARRFAAAVRREITANDNRGPTRGADDRPLDAGGTGAEDASAGRAGDGAAGPTGAGGSADRLSVDTLFAAVRRYQRAGSDLFDIGADGKPQLVLPRSDHAAAVQGLTGQRTPAGLAPAAGPQPEAVNLREALTDLHTSLDMPWRQGHMHIEGEAEYGFPTGVGRTKEFDDFEALSHEIGHHIEARSGAPLVTLVSSYPHEIAPLAYAGTAKGEELREGFAEFVRLYVTNRTYAENAAPGFAAAFRELLGTRQPEWLGALDRGERAYSAYLNADPGETIKANLATTYKPGGVKGIQREIKDKGLSTTIADWFSNGYTSMFDELNPIHVAVRKLAAIHRANTGQWLDLKTIDDPYKLARLALDSYSAGHMDLIYGVHGYQSLDPSGPSLREALVEGLGAANAFGKWDDAAARDFGGYLVSRRALFEWDRFAAGLIPNPPTAEPRAYHARNVADSEAAHPNYVSAAAKVHEWTGNLLKKRLDAGLITPEQYAEDLQILDYVPFYRDMSDKAKVGGGGTDKTGERQILNKRFEGSNRPIINPIESLMRQAYETNATIRQNDVIKALDRLARDVGNGGGKIAERIPNSQLSVTEVSVETVLSNAAKKMGISPTDARLMADSVSGILGGDATASLFKMGQIGPSGEPIVFFWDGGQRVALRLADGDFGVAMFQSLTGMTEQMKQLWVDVVSKPSALFRAGVTTSPDFLISNWIRDQVSAWVLTSEGFVPFVDGIRGTIAEVSQGDLARRYNVAGGITGGANVAALRDARLKHDFQALAKQGYVVNRMTSVEGVLQLAEVTETGTRLGVFKKAYDRSIADGLSPYEAAAEAAFVARDYVDFGRHGSKMAAAQRLIPFINAAMQGMDKANRVLIVPAIKHMTGAVLTTADQRDLAVSKMAWAKLAALGMFSLGLRALYFDDDDYNEVSEYIRATHWVFKLEGNQILTVPKPFELGIIPNLFERAAEAWYQNDPKAFERFRAGMFNILAPPNIFDAPAIKLYNELRSGVDSFTGKDIIPDHLKGVAPYLQYTASTSAFSKQMGKAIGMSPAILDHVVIGSTASWGRGLLALYDMASGEKPTAGWDDSFITRRFIKDVSRGATSTRQFWDLVSRTSGTMTGAANSYEILSQQGAGKEAADLLAGLDERAKTYVTLAESKFDADTRRLHPINRAQDALGVISKLRKEVVFGDVKTKHDLDPIALTRTQRAEIDDCLSRIAMEEAGNALTVIEAPGWAQRKTRDLEPSYAVLRAISPDFADELAARYAMSKVYTSGAVAGAWPELKKRLLGDGSDAMLHDLRGEVKSDGYEMSSVRRRAAKKPRIPIAGNVLR